MSEDAISLRAERLGVAVFMFGLVNEPPRKAMEATWPLLSGYEIALFRHLTDDDTALANACLQAEGERRARQWDALERFDALMNGRPEGESYPTPRSAS